jgi:CheY-like chemotaxis protein
MCRAKERPMAPEGAKQVLVVEDDSITCKVLRIALEHRGQAVEIVESYAAAVQALELAEGDGLATLHRIRNNHDAPVVVVTPTPFAPHELVDRVDRALAA